MHSPVIAPSQVARDTTTIITVEETGILTAVGEAQARNVTVAEKSAISPDPALRPLALEEAQEVREATQATPAVRPGKSFLPAGSCWTL